MAPFNLTSLDAAGAASGRMVFAHYMVGLTDGQSSVQWATDIADAQAAGIDGFALNVGPSDAWNGAQLPAAYEAADASGFNMFISFDMATNGLWPESQVTDYVNQYKAYGSQLTVDGLPMVSTFEGPDFAGWAGVRANTGGIFLMPDWASLGAAGVGARVGEIDGAFSWGAWPQANVYDMNNGEDMAYLDNLGGKPFMMGVSPYFYTNLPQWSKNWYSSSDNLWFERWREVFEVMPAYIELITWNDYGESSYLNNPVASQIVSGSEVYVNGFDHSAFRFPLSYFIPAYKAGTPDIAVPTEGAMGWYRTTPKAVCSDGGTVWGQGGSASAADGTEDVISVIAIANAEPAVSVSIGGVSQTPAVADSFGHAYFYRVPFNGNAGDVTITMNGKSTTGPAIINTCPASGHVNFNAASIQVV
ncbi:glycoside hydrolase family 71 protein [Xylariomycetidae sp. FL0641]|nr:glycoside hydrolase family 71 protein [Xylariomycetidae sp. FL0641]